MPRASDFPPLGAVIQEVTLTFDFGPMLPAGVTLTGAPTVTCTVESGVDPDPSSRLLGPAVIGTAPPPSGSNVPNAAVLQQIGSGVADVTYLLVCSCPTSVGDVAELWSLISCVEPGDNG